MAASVSTSSAITTSMPLTSPVPVLIPKLFNLGIVPTADEPKMIYSACRSGPFYTIELIPSIASSESEHGSWTKWGYRGSTCCRREDELNEEVGKKLDILMKMASNVVRMRILMEKPLGWCGLMTGTNVIQCGDEHKEIWDLTVRSMEMMSDDERKQLIDDDAKNFYNSLLNYHYRLLKYATPLLRQSLHADAFVMLNKSSMGLIQAWAGGLPSPIYKLVFDREKDGKYHDIMESRMPFILEYIMTDIYNDVLFDCVNTDDERWLKQVFGLFEEFNWPEYVGKQIFEIMRDYMKRLKKYVSGGYALLTGKM